MDSFIININNSNNNNNEYSSKENVKNKET